MQQAELRPFAQGELAGFRMWLEGRRKLEVCAGESFAVPVSITNGSEVTVGTYRWVHPFPVFLSYVWRESSTGKAMPQDGTFTGIWHPIAPGEECLVHARVRAPRVPGSYLLYILLFQQGARWYDDASEVRPLPVRVEVRESAANVAGRINDYEGSVYSQNGEDGILRELFLRLGYLDPFLVEFGAGDGLISNSALWVRQYKWNALLIEGDPSNCASIEQTIGRREGVTVVNSLVTVDNIVDLFQRNNVPREFDLLSIDIDGNDYWLWEALADYRPRVVVIECNRTIKPPGLWVMAYNPNHAWDPVNSSAYTGASLESLARLGKRLGYALLGTDSNDINAFFVRDDLLERCGFPAVSASEAYHDDPYRWPEGWKPQYGNGPYLEQ